MNKLFHKYPYSSIQGISGLGASVLISSPKIVSQQDRNLRKEELLAILIRPIGELNIPITTGYGSILTSMENLVEASRLGFTDLADAVPYQYLLEFASRAGISLPASFQISIKQKIAEGKGGLAHNDNPTTAQLIDTSKMIVNDPEPEEVEGNLDTKSASMTTTTPFSNSTRLLIGLVALAALGGSIWMISTNSKKEKQKPNQAKKPSK